MVDHFRVTLATHHIASVASQPPVAAASCELRMGLMTLPDQMVQVLMALCLLLLFASPRLPPWTAFCPHWLNGDVSTHALQNPCSLIRTASGSVWASSFPLLHVPPFFVNAVARQTQAKTTRQHGEELPLCENYLKEGEETHHES